MDSGIVVAPDSIGLFGTHYSDLLKIFPISPFDVISDKKEEAFTTQEAGIMP